MPTNHDALLLSHALRLDLQGHFVTIQYATGFERLIPGQTELFSADGALGLNTDASVAPWVNAGSGFCYVKGYAFCNATDGQISRDLQRGI